LISVHGEHNDGERSSSVGAHGDGEPSSSVGEACVLGEHCVLGRVARFFVCGRSLGGTFGVRGAAARAKSLIQVSVKVVFANDESAMAAARARGRAVAPSACKPYWQRTYMYTEIKLYIGLTTDRTTVERLDDR
jgi:hypothetical protein